MIRALLLTNNFVTLAKLQLKHYITFISTKKYCFCMDKRVEEKKLFEVASERSGKDINSWEEFKELPTIDKENILEDSESDVLFKTKEKYLGGQTTSGTSGRMAAVMKTKADYEKEKGHNKKRLPIFFDEKSRVMILISSSWGHGILRDLREEGIFGKMGNPYDLNYSAEIVENMRIDSLFCNPAFALQIGRILEREERERFETLALGGSALSKPGREELESLFQNADIHKCYGSTESGSVAYQRERESGTNKYVIDTDHHYVEILDKEGNEVKTGEEGEITITNLWENSGIPLLRYRTGDRGLITEQGLLEVMGRLEFDSVKIGGLTVYSENFENAMREVSELLKPEYQVIVKEEKEGENVKPYFIVKAAPRTGFTKDDLVKARTEERLMEEFKITPEKSWKDMAENSVFGRIKIELVEEEYFDESTPSIVDHRGDR